MPGNNPNNVEGEEGNREERIKSMRRAHLAGFIIVAVAAILILTLLGAGPLLIIEVFGLAAILGVSAVMVIIIFGGRTRIRV